MGFWNFYFIVKLFLFAQHHLGFHPWKNLTFALFLLIPLSQKHWKVLRQLVAIPAAIALLYHDSLLPPVSRLWSQLDVLANFSADYFAELLGRFFSIAVLLELLLLLIVYCALNLKLRMSTFVIAAMLLVPLLPSLTIGRPTIAAASDTNFGAGGGSGATGAGTEAPTEASLNRQLDGFYQAEKKRRIAFPNAVADFDVVFIHVCSLAWDDLKLIGQDRHPLFGKFDMLFRQFNSAASYSGPAAIRLLRGSCGQSRHDALYDNAPAQCFTFNNLAQAGFQPELLMNHDGHFGHFLQDIQVQGGLNVTPQANTLARVDMHAFDQSPIYDDYDELSQWWKKRIDSGPERVALYYNTISLHDGNRVVGSAASSMKSYPMRAQKLLGDVDRFLTLVQSSGRKAVVVFVPEHGASLRGDNAQISGMREIPNPQITRVPVGIKLIGMTAVAPQQQINDDVSYLALSAVLGNVITGYGASGAGLDVSALLADLPRTAFVAENENLVIMQRGLNYFSRNADDVWLPNE